MPRTSGVSIATKNVYRSLMDFLRLEYPLVDATPAIDWFAGRRLYYWVAAHAVDWYFCLLILSWTHNSFKKVGADVGIEMSSAMMFVLDLANLIVDFWWVFVLFLFPALLVSDFTLLAMFRKNAPTAAHLFNACALLFPPTFASVMLVCLRRLIAEIQAAI